MQRKVYILENLDCANCAAKIERKLSKLPELNDVSVTFATKQLRFEAEDPEAVLPKIRETIQSMEPDEKELAVSAKQQSITMSTTSMAMKKAVDVVMTIIMNIMITSMVTKRAVDVATTITMNTMSIMITSMVTKRAVDVDTSIIMTMVMKTAAAAGMIIIMNHPNHRQRDHIRILK